MRSEPFSTVLRNLYRPLAGIAVMAGSTACGKPASTAPDVAISASAPEATLATGSADVTPVAGPSTPVAPNPKPPLKLAEGWRSLDRDAAGLALSSDGRWLVSGDLGGHVAYFDRQHPDGTRFVWGELAKAGRVRAVACAEAAPTCIAAGSDGPDHSLRRHDLTTLADRPVVALSPVLVPPTTAGATQADALATALSADGVRQIALLALGGEALGGQVLLTSGPTFERLGAFPVPRAGGALALVADGGVAVWASPGGGLWRFDFPHPAAGTPLPGAGFRVAEGPTLSHLAARRNATGDLIIHGAEGTTVHVWALPVSGEPHGDPNVARLQDAGVEGSGAPIRGLHRVGDHTVAVTRPSGGGLGLWDADNGKLLATLATDCPCEAHALSADGSTAACRCATGAWVRHGPTRLALSEAPAMAPTIPATTLPSAAGADGGFGPSGAGGDAHP